MKRTQLSRIKVILTELLGERGEVWRAEVGVHLSLIASP